MIKHLALGAFCGGAGWLIGHGGEKMTIALLAGALVAFAGRVVFEAAAPPGGGENSRWKLRR